MLLRLSQVALEELLYGQFVSPIMQFAQVALEWNRANDANTTIAEIPRRVFRLLTCANFVVAEEEEEEEDRFVYRESAAAAASHYCCPLVQ